GGGLSEDCFDSDFTLMGCLVSQHRLPGHVANGVNVLFRRASLLVHADKAFFVQLYLRVLQSQPPAIRSAADCDQDTAKDWLTLGYLFAFERGADAVL